MKKMIMSLGILFFAATAVNAAPVTLNFDDLPHGMIINGLDYYGLIFDGPDAIRVMYGNELASGTSSAPYSIAAGSLGMGEFRVVFPELVAFVGITAGDAGGDTDSYRIDVYGETDDLLASFESGIFGGNPEVTSGFFGDSVTGSISLLDPLISYAWFTPTSASNSGISWDDLVYDTVPTAVPEPSTLFLFGTGLVGIGVFRRKFKG